MPRTVYEISNPGVTVLQDERTGYSWESSVNVLRNGYVKYQLSVVNNLRITKATSTGQINFRRSNKGVRNKESRFINFVFVKNGYMDLVYNFSQRRIGSGCFAVMENYQSYHTYSVSEDIMEVTSVLIPKYEIFPLTSFDIEFDNIVDGNENHFDVLYGISNLLFEIGESMAPEQSRKIVSVLIDYAASWMDRQKMDNPRRNSITRRFGEIELYIQNNLSDPNLGSRIICNEFRISEKYLSVIMKNHGTKLRDLINAKRIAKAQLLLEKPLRTGETIKEIGGMVGYRNPAHFAATFRMLSGLSPSQYLANRKGQFPMETNQTER